MKKIRIGVMGCANIARRTMIPTIQSLPANFELVAIASRTADKAVECANAFGVTPIEGYNNLIDRADIDAIYMPLPTGLHDEWITRSLEAGKHLLVEKSLAMDFDSASRLTEMARSKNLLIMENFMFRHHSQHNFTWQVLKEKRIGDVRLFRSQFGFPPLSADNFRYNKADGGGALLDAGAYTIRASQWFLGPKLEVATATLFIDKATGVDMYGSATLLNRQGITAQLSFGFDNFYQCNYEFWGSKGKLVAQRAFTPKPQECPVITLEKQGELQTENMPEDDHFKNILLAFYKGIIENNREEHWQDVLTQSKILTDVRNTAVTYEI